MRHVARWAFGHRADLLAALVYGCLAYLSFNALADYANAHTIGTDGGHLFPQPYGGWALAVAVDGSVLYAFISFRRARVMATTLLVVGAATTYLLQRWHAEADLHPLIVAGVVPGLMVLVTLAWHLIREAAPVRFQTEPRPVARDGPPPGPPGQQPAPGPTRTRAVHVQARARGRTKRGPVALDRDQVATWLAEDRSQRWIADQLGLTSGQRTRDLAPLVRQLRNGDGEP